MSAVEVFVQRRFRCPHCRRSWTKKATAETHIATCWRDIANRVCVTCEHHMPAEAGGCTERGGCQCQDTDECCEVDAARFDDDGRYVVRTACPSWEPARWVAGGGS